MRRTKIVATIGPATSEPDAIKALLDAGVDVVRLNAAHGPPDVLAVRAAVARAAAASLERVVGVLIDLPGPKLRTGPVENDEVELRMDSRFVLTAQAIEGDEHRVSTTVPQLARWVRVGVEVFLADGAIVLCVEQINGDDVECRVVRAGVLRSHKGMHVRAPRVTSSPSPTPTRSRSKWPCGSRPTSSVSPSSAIRKTSRPCALASRSAVRDPTSSRRSKPRSHSTTSPASWRRRMP
jgi:pyruvate kinase